LASSGSRGLSPTRSGKHGNQRQRHLSVARQGERLDLVVARMAESRAVNSAVVREEQTSLSPFMHEISEDNVANGALFLLRRPPTTSLRPGCQRPRDHQAVPRERAG
jgi:hypothetical protein